MPYDAINAPPHHLCDNLILLAILLSRLISDVVFIALVFCECYFFALVNQGIDCCFPGRMFRDITTIYSALFFVCAVTCLSLAYLLVRVDPLVFKLLSRTALR